jgi:ankyrin repeat protein
MSLADLIIYETEKSVILAIQNQEVDLEEFDRFGFRPLIESVICKKINVLNALIAHGIDIEQQDIIGRTALQWASDQGDLEICKILLAHGANPNHASEDGQPILAYPILREQLELITLLQENGGDLRFAQDFISAKLVGHRFELTGETDIITPEGIFIPLSYEGFYLEFTCDLIRRSLNNYINSIPGQKYSEYTQKINTIARRLSLASTLMEYSKYKNKAPFVPIINQILNNDPLIIPVGHAGHAITFIKCGKFFAKCDRGVGNIADTTVVYRLTNPSAFTLEFLQKLIYESKTDNFMKHELKELLGLKFVQNLPTKSQISGNCSWANVEASVPALLFMLSINDLNDKMESNRIKKEIVAFYYAWVEWDKDSALDEALNDFDNSAPPRQLSKAMSLASILVQRCNAKKNKEVARAKKILARLTNPNYQFILYNIRVLYGKNNAKDVGKNILDLYEKCGLDINTYVLSGSRVPVNTSGDNLLKMTTALHVACLNGELNSIKYLLEKANMDVNFLDRTGSTALMYAAWKGHLEIVKYMVLQHKANTKIANYKGGTALRYARYGGHTELAEFLLQF